MSVSEELARLAQLRDQGVLTEEEFQAQKRELLSGSQTSAVPPQTVEPKKTVNRKGCLGAVAFVVAIIILMGIIGGKSNTTGGGTDSTETTEAAAPVLDVTATELFEAYQANEAAAQQQYGDKRLRVKGTISGVDLDMADNPVVQLATPNQFMSAAAHLADGSKDKAASLTKGQSITLVCAKVTEVIGVPQLGECEIE